MLSAEVEVQVLTPDGLAATLAFELLQPGHPPRAGVCGTPLPALPGRAEVVFAQPPGRFRLDVPDPSSDSASAPSTTRLSLTLAELCVWLSDPGGRELGGLSVVASATQGEVWGRVGQPILLWPGPWTLRLGAPAAGIPWRRFRVDVRGSRTTLELGRLASLTIRWGRARGWPVLAHPLELARGPSTSPPADAPVQATLGRSGEAFTLWPGQWLVSLDGGADAELEVKGGHHTEVDLLALEAALNDEDAAALSQTATPAASLRDLSRAARTAFTSRVSQRLSQALTPEALPGPLKKLLERTGSGLTRELDRAPEALLDALWSSRSPHPADKALAAPPPEPSQPGLNVFRLLLKDARGYELSGWPFVLTAVSQSSASQPLEGEESTAPAAASASSPAAEPPSTGTLRGRMGLWTEAAPGLYQLQLEGLLPHRQRIRVGGPGAPQSLELPPLGALELILRDAQGVSLRSASYRLSSLQGQTVAALGRPYPLEAGTYAVEVPVRPGLSLEVKVVPGQVRVVDLGALGELLVEHSQHTPWGTALTFSRIDGPLPGGEITSTLRGTEVSLRAGIPLHVLPGRYRQLSPPLDGASSPERLVRAGRARKPSTQGRSNETLAPDDANRDSGLPRETTGKLP